MGMIKNIPPGASRVSRIPNFPTLQGFHEVTMVARFGGVRRGNSTSRGGMGDEDRCDPVVYIFIDD
jgi:hypothetical protein